MTLNNISGNIIKILNDDYVIILFYFLDNMKKLTEEHIMRKIRIKYIPVEMRYAVPVYHNPEFILFMYFENKFRSEEHTSELQSPC